MKSKEEKTSTHYKKNFSGTPVMSKAVADRMHRFVNLSKAMFRKGATSGGRTFNVCFAVKKSKIIAIGLNDYDRQMTGYNKRLKTNYKFYGEGTYKPCLHSEVAVILKLGLDDCSDISFYNVRLSRTCHCCNSQPCMNCFRILKMVGYKHIYFFDDNMNICEK